MTQTSKKTRWWWPSHVRGLRREVAELELRQQEWSRISGDIDALDPRLAEDKAKIEALQRRMVERLLHSMPVADPEDRNFQRILVTIEEMVDQLFAQSPRHTRLQDSSIPAAEREVIGLHRSILRLNVQYYVLWGVYFLLYGTLLAAGLAVTALAIYVGAVDLLLRFAWSDGSYHQLRATVVLFLVGLSLYVMRRKFRRTYAITELIVALCAGYFGLEGVSYQNIGLSGVIALSSAVYLIVRGLDNLVVGHEAAKRKRMEEAALARVGEANANIAESVSSAPAIDPQAG